MKILIVFLALLPTLLSAQYDYDSLMNNGNIIYTDLNQALKNPESVYILDLSKQKLESIPMDVFKFSNLEILVLSKNKIEQIPSEIKLLKNLKVLDLSRNKLVRVPAEIGQLINLEILILNQNAIYEMAPEIGSLKKLKVLDVWGNELDEMPYEISFLKGSLELLDMRVIYMTAEKQQAIIELLPYTQIYFSNSCNCR